jgi:hypothetical protein
MSKSLVAYARFPGRQSPCQRQVDRGIRDLLLPDGLRQIAAALFPEGGLVYNRPERNFKEKHEPGTSRSACQGTRVSTTT